MSCKKSVIIIILLLFLPVAPVFAESVDSNIHTGAIFTFWPLLDYRESPRDGFSNLALLGPLFKFQKNKDDTDLAVRPLFYRTSNSRNETSSADYLYPLASRDASPQVATFQFLRLLQSNTYRKDEPENRKNETMFFPFYIRGESEKYGPYTAVVPFYGNIYERFWRDEYHFVLFPLYGRTVNKGTTTRNYLFPFFSTTEGEGESGFRFWPLYGQASKEGSYNRRFALWPIFSTANRGLDTDNPVHEFYILPFYAAIDSPKKVSRYYLWPFFGYSDDFAKEQHEVNYFWPFWGTVRGKTRNVTRVLPFYSVETGTENSKRWYMWPLLKREEINSTSYSQNFDRILFFLYTDNREKWPRAGDERRRIAFWPLFVYKKDPRGVKSLTMPAPVEPVLDREGIEKNWAPLWRIYQQRWNDAGDSAVSFLWNLYWHEVRGEELAYEFFPLIQFQSDTKMRDLKLLKGFIRYQNMDGSKHLSLLWLPFGFSWGKAAAVDADASATSGSIR